MRELKKCKLNKEWMHIAQHRAKWRSIVYAVVTELNEDAEEMEKMEKIRGEASIRSDRPTVYSTWLHFYSPNTRQVLSITNDRNMSSSSSDPLLLSLPSNLETTMLYPNRVQRLRWGQ